MKKRIAAAIIAVGIMNMLAACGNDTAVSASEAVLEEDNILEEDFDNDSEDGDSLSEEQSETNPSDDIKGKIISEEAAIDQDAVYLAPVKLDDDNYTFIDPAGNIFDDSIKEPYISSFNKAGTALVNHSADYANQVWEYMCFDERGTFNHYLPHYYDTKPGNGYSWMPIGANGYFGAKRTYGENQGLWSFKSADRETDALYRAVGSFGDFDYAPVMDPDTNLWGYVDIYGNYLVDPYYKNASNFVGDGYAVVQDSEGTYYYLDTEGNRTGRFENYETSSRHLVNIIYSINNDCGILFHSDSDGSESDNGYYVINKYGDMLAGPYCALASSDDLGLFACNSTDTDTNWFNSFINSNGDVLIQTESLFRGSSGFNRFGVCCIDDGNALDPFGTGVFAYDCVIDTDGNYIVEPGRYDSIKAYGDNGLAAVWVKDDTSDDPTAGLWGYINTKGEEVIAPQFKDADSFAAVYMSKE